MKIKRQTDFGDKFRELRNTGNAFAIDRSFQRFLAPLSRGAAQFHKETQMPRYLIQANYVGDGVKGLLKEGGTSRRAATEKAIKSLGGTLEAFYYAFGETDAYAIVDVPDNASMAAIALTAGASGAIAVKTTVLLTPEEVDEAVKKAPSSRPPGG
jgi:uncharacterized protein with GYD domain